MFHRNRLAAAHSVRFRGATLIRRVSLVLGLSITLPLHAAAAPPELVVRVNNVRDGHGLVHVDVCPEGSFLKQDCPYSAEAPARAGMTEVAIRGLPPGRYAVQTFHDENANHRVDRGMFGIPREGIGFSNDASIHFGPPRWANAEFEYHGGNQQIDVTTRYFTGAPGPGKG
jgi:uncharacterized protein (DUF2141 family)